MDSFKKQNLILVIFALLLTVETSYAATITVTSTAQEIAPFTADGDCSLGEAIRAANTDSPVDGCGPGAAAGDTINLQAGATYSVSFIDNNNGNGDNAFPLISSSITLNGQGSTIEFSLNKDNMRAFEVSGSGTLILQDLTIAGFGGGLFVFESGGGILINAGGSASLDTVMIAETFAGTGGAIYNGRGGASTLTVTDSTLDNNGAIFALSGGDGGGIFNESGSVTLINSTLSGNDAGSEGGGLYNQTGASATITQSLLFLNIATGDGGGIWNEGTLTVTNSTLTDNQTPAIGGGFGGGLYNRGGTAEFEGVTVANNANGTAALFIAGGQVGLHNTIVALNTGGGGGQSQDIAGTIKSDLFHGYNLVGECDVGVGCDTGPGNLSGTVASPLDPQLGGFTGQFYPLLSGSPAVDAGDPASCPATDQRGQARPIDGNGDGTARCDIGSYERVPFFILVLPSACGNGVTEGAEVCDDGNTDNNDACLNTCVSASCGDGFIQTGVEQCDDANTANGDGCSSACQTETSSTPPPSSTPPSSPAPADTGGAGGSGVSETGSDVENGTEVDTAETDSETTDEEAANAESAAPGGCSRFVGVKERADSRRR